MDRTDGEVFSLCFDADGATRPDGSAVAWRWRHLALTDMRARRLIEQELALPEPTVSALLSGDESCHVDFEDGWLFGQLPDLRHEHYADGFEAATLRFAFHDGLLVTGRKRPLQSVEAVRQSAARGARRFRSPAALVEALLAHQLDRLSRKTAELVQELDRIEDLIVGDAWQGVRDSLTSTRREGVMLHRQIATMTHLFRAVEHLHSNGLPDEAADMMARVGNRVTVLHHDAEQVQARARLLQDELVAKLAAQSNRLLYFMSVMTAVLLPMTVVSGLFGMNVGGIPFGESSAGFWSVSALSAGLAVSIYALVVRLSRRG